MVSMAHPILLPKQDYIATPNLFTHTYICPTLDSCCIKVMTCMGEWAIATAIKNVHIDSNAKLFQVINLHIPLDGIQH